MKDLASSSNEEMVAVFLHGELASPRFGDTIRAALHNRKLDSALIEDPNLTDKTANTERAAILLEYRPWLVDFGLLKQWPPNALWRWVDLTRKDIDGLVYVTYDYWDKLSNETHLVREGARSVRIGKRVLEVSNDSFWEVARQIDAGKDVPPIIVLSGGTNNPNIVSRAIRELRATYLPIVLLEACEPCLALLRVNLTSNSLASLSRRGSRRTTPPASSDTAIVQ